MVCKEIGLVVLGVLSTAFGIWLQSKFVLKNKIKEEIAQKWVKAHSEASEKIENIRAMLLQASHEATRNYILENDRWFFYNRPFLSCSFADKWLKIKDKSSKIVPPGLDLHIKEFPETMENLRKLADEAQSDIMEAVYNPKNWSWWKRFCRF